ncbi:ribosome recycling factor [Bremerella sp. P1]|uniref:ribosome recycling factor n=1 Tax=Bremerella sp. P1 TaxID=3026424 RepID=UPI0023686524|nr:ribosome recycling factor [Bremerella sp. P1]WDI40117.1 ribosome recycling factor [Bremerella sp. P1]
MNADQITEDATQRMEKAIDVLKNGLSGVRTGRATPGLVDSLRVEVYGSLQPIKQIASVSVPEPSQLLIRPYDTGAIKDIEKAIVASDLGMAPQSDGRVIRLNVPQLSTEVRKKLVSRIKELAEESRVSIRNIRRDANKAADTAEKDKTISEDIRDDIKDNVQELTKKYEDQVNDLAKTKEKDVMED